MRKYIISISSKATIILTTFLFSCISTRSYVSFEILEPAPLTYPENVQSIGFLNRAPLTTEAFSEINSEKMDRLTLHIIDSIFCKNLLRGFKEGIEQANVSYLQDLTVLERRRYDTSLREEEMSKQYRDHLFQENEIDILVSFEYYHLQVKKSPSFYSSDYSDYVQEYSLFLEILWRVYLAGNDKAFDTYKQHDTLYFVNKFSEPSENYVTGLDVVRDGSKDFGFYYGIRHTPLWNTIYRVIFTGYEYSLNRAVEYTDKGDWESANEIWLKNLQESDKDILRSKSAHNLAVYYEMQDELETALNYAQQADSLWSTPLIESHMQDLEIRVANKTDLLKQVR